MPSCVRRRRLVGGGHSPAGGAPYTIPSLLTLVYLSTFALLLNRERRTGSSTLVDWVGSESYLLSPLNRSTTQARSGGPRYVPTTCLFRCWMRVQATLTVRLWAYVHNAKSLLLVAWYKAARHRAV
jgi:hypothetical protein